MLNERQKIVLEFVRIYSDLSAKAVFKNRLRFDDSCCHEFGGPVFWDTMYIIMNTTFI